jgi:hypothetical protein
MATDAEPPLFLNEHHVIEVEIAHGDTIGERSIDHRGPAVRADQRALGIAAEGGDERPHAPGGGCSRADDRAAEGVEQQQAGLAKHER